MAERPVVAVLGLGGVGGPLALALRESGRYASVVGWDPDFDAARQAQKHNVADRYARRAPDAARDAALVFVATGPAQFQETLAAVAPHLRPGAVVCSLMESHETAARIAAQALPASVSFVGGHPILAEPADAAGAPSAPSAGVFREAVFCIAPTASAHPDAVAYVTQVAESLGMQPFFVDPREHDAFFSAIGRLPAVLAAALMRVVARERSWRELGRLAGGEFRHATALADADPPLQQEALAAGREHLVRWLGAMVDELSGLRDALQDGREPADFFASAAEARRQWLRDRRVPPEVADLPAAPPAPKRRLWL